MIILKWFDMNVLKCLKIKSTLINAAAGFIGWCPRNQENNTEILALKPC